MDGVFVCFFVAGIAVIGLIVLDTVRLLMVGLRGFLLIDCLRWGVILCLIGLWLVCGCVLLLLQTDVFD